MLSRKAEARFKEGMQLLARGHARDALPFFSAAIEMQKEWDEDSVARYQSYYGLCLSLARGSHREAMRRCRMAVQAEDYNPDLWWNLGRVALNFGKRADAHQALQRGLRLEPDHAGIRGDLQRMGLRKPQVLSFLSRQHPINIALGRMRREPGAGQAAGR